MEFVGELAGNVARVGLPFFHVFRVSHVSLKIRTIHSRAGLLVAADAKRIG